MAGKLSDFSVLTIDLLLNVLCLHSQIPPVSRFLQHVFYSLFHLWLSEFSL